MRTIKTYANRAPFYNAFTSGSWSMMLKMGLGFGLLRNKFSVHPLAAEHARRTTKKANPEVRPFFAKASCECASLQIQFRFAAATSTVPSGLTLTVIIGFGAFICAKCFSSVEVLKSYVDCHDPSDTVARKYWLP